MRIVAACMHFPGKHRRVRCSGGLCTGQSVHLRPQANRHFFGVTTRNPANYGVADTCVVTRNFETFKLGYDSLGCIGLFKSQFGMLMKPASEHDKPGEQIVSRLVRDLETGHFLLLQLRHTRKCLLNLIKAIPYPSPGWMSGFLHLNLSRLLLFLTFRHENPQYAV